MMLDRAPPLEPPECAACGFDRRIGLQRCRHPAGVIGRHDLTGLGFRDGQCCLGDGGLEADHPLVNEREALVVERAIRCTKRREAVEDLAWSMMNSLEFVFNH